MIRHHNATHHTTPPAGADRDHRKFNTMASSITGAPWVRLPVALLLLLAAGLRGSVAAPNTAALSVLCNGAVYGAGDPFATSLAYVLSEMLSAMPARPGHDFYDISPFPTAFA
ncbi:hypothetical protein EJB05_10797, partial [Eragrostis curvula]